MAWFMLSLLKCNNYDNYNLDSINLEPSVPRHIIIRVHHRCRNTFCFGGGATSVIEMYYGPTREETHSKRKWEFETLVDYFEENGH